MILLEYNKTSLVSVTETNSINFYGGTAIKVENVNIQDFIGNSNFAEYSQDHNSQVYSPIHYHQHSESRLILFGSAKFFFPNKDNLLVLQVNDLVRIDLNPEIDHWYKSSGELQAIQLFSIENYQACYRDYSEYQYLHDYFNPENHKLYA